MAGEIVLLDQQHRQSAARGIARDADTVDAAADDEEVEPVSHPCLRRRRLGEGEPAATFFVFGSEAYWRSEMFASENLGSHPETLDRYLRTRRHPSDP